MGMACWEQRPSDKTALMLLPGEWYAHIPDGFEIESISGKKTTFRPGKSDRDIRFGCLAYGVRVPDGGEFDGERS